jgi:hypothetical protein
MEDGRRGDGERTVVGFGPEMENAQWRACEWSTAAGLGVVDDGGLTVRFRRGDGEREGKIWGENGYRMKGDGFSTF